MVHLKVAVVPAGIPVTPDVGDEGVVIEAVPLTRLHEPVPCVMVLPASVKLASLQCVWSGPAFGTVEAGTLVSITSSVVAGQVPFETVHLKVALVPAVTLVMPDVREPGVVMPAVPLTRLHVPVPVPGAVAVMVKLPLLQFVLSAPALATEGDALLVNITASDEVQPPFVMVQVKVALVPVGTPVTPDVGEVLVVMIAVPLVTDHKPVPTEGVLPASVKLPLLQLPWSAPAAAVVATALLVSTTSSVEAVHGLLVTVHLKVALVPTGTPVTVVVLDDKEVIEAVPLTKLHAPVPKVGAVAFMVKLAVLHNV